ncbi:MAG: hypothetical protein WAN75_10545 [Xanthobacteraceae bacterium]
MRTRSTSFTMDWGAGTMGWAHVRVGADDQPVRTNYVPICVALT